MTREEYRTTAMDVVYLAACAVHGTVPDGERVQAMNLDLLYQVASRHLLTAITAMVLESAGVKDERFTQDKGKAIRKVILMDLERKAVLEKLDEAGIWYMPLKGSVLKELYPRVGMRQMADNDILYDASRSEDVREIMESLGFTTVMYVKNQYNHDHYDKEPVCNFEMHRALFPPSAPEKLFLYYLNVRDRLVKDEGNGFGYHFTDEDFYLYMIAHEYKHYSGGGTGLRSLLDTYLYLNKYGETLNWDYLSGELEQLGLTEYEQQNRTMALDLFQKKPLSDEEREMLDYILSSGTYGTVENRVKNQIQFYGGGVVGKIRYCFRRVFLPMDSVQSAFPLFYRHKIFLPLLPFYRMGRGLLYCRSALRAELKQLRRNQ